MSELKRAEPPCAVSRAEHFLSLHWQWQLTPRFSIGTSPKQKRLSAETNAAWRVFLKKKRNEHLFLSSQCQTGDVAIGSGTYYYVVCALINYNITCLILGCSGKGIVDQLTTQPKSMEYAA